MIKRLTKHGNSMAIVLDKPVLELLKIDADTVLEVSTDGKALIIAPVRDAARNRKFKKALEKANMRYGRTLKRLAE